MASRACLLLLMACAASDAFTLQRRSPLRTAASPRTEHRRPVVSASLDQLVVPAAMPSTITLANNDMSLSGSQVAGYFGFLLLLITIPFVGGTMTRSASASSSARTSSTPLRGRSPAGEDEAGGAGDGGLQVSVGRLRREDRADRGQEEQVLGMNRYWMQLRNDPEADIEPGDVKANRDRIVPGMDGRGFVPGDGARGAEEPGEPLPASPGKTASARRGSSEIRDLQQQQQQQQQQQLNIKPVATMDGGVCLRPLLPRAVMRGVVKATLGHLPRVAYQ